MSVKYAGDDSLQAIRDWAREEFLSNNYNHGLPIGYTRLAFIKGDGTAYINSGITPKTNTCIRASLIPIRSQGVYRQEIGTRESSFTKSWQLSNGALNGSYFLAFDDTQSHHVVDNISSVINVSINEESNGSFVVNENVIATDLNLSESAYPFYIMALNQSDVKTGYCSISIFISVEFLEGSTVVSSLVPCLRNSDNKVGMYDIVRNQFLTNANSSGELLAGPVVPSNTDANTISPLSVSANGTYTPPQGVDGYAPVVVDVENREIIAQWSWYAGGNFLGACAFKTLTGDVYDYMCGGNIETTFTGSLVSIKWYGGNDNSVITALASVELYVYDSDTDDIRTPTIIQLDVGETYTLSQSGLGTLYYVEVKSA